METTKSVVMEICEAFRTHASRANSNIRFVQLLPDSATEVKIYTKQMSWKEYYETIHPGTIPSSFTQVYRISVNNDRTDTVFNSSPITEVFAGYLPKLVGEIEVSGEQLATILTDLITAKQYFGISVGLFDDNKTIFYKHLPQN
jgi:hypothetical protein